MNCFVGKALWGIFGEGLCKEDFEERCEELSRQVHEECFVNLCEEIYGERLCEELCLESFVKSFMKIIVKGFVKTLVKIFCKKGL